MMRWEAQPCMFPGPVLRPGNWPFGDLEPWGYDLIMADPPWRFELYSEETGAEKSAQAHYACMDLDAISALPVSDLARRDCLLWLWCTAPMLDQQIAVAKRWGFEFKTSGVWLKQTRRGKTHFGTGYVLRSCHEPFVIATRGEPKIASKSVRSVVFGAVREHSRKPAAAYAAAAELMGPAARRLELFARTPIKGWDAWGDEAGKFSDADDLTIDPVLPDGAGLTTQTGDA